MAIVDIHINKKVMIKHIVETVKISVNSASDYVLNKTSMMGFYNLKSKHICLMLDRINSCEKYFESDDMAKRVCYCLTHEEIHHWLDENEDAIACWKFDNIAKKFMEGMI